MLDLNQINKTWTLFLDRDGVINHEKPGNYIHTWGEFKFYDGVFEAIKIFSLLFKLNIVITNQRGIGKGITKLDDLHTIHANMEHAIEQHGGRIDAVYYCGALDSDNPFRKPNIGMGLEAVKRFPDIDLAKSIMVGNTMSDMQFGRNLGVKTVFIASTNPEVDGNDERIDMVFPSLISFATALAVNNPS